MPVPRQRLRTLLVIIVPVAAFEADVVAVDFARLLPNPRPIPPPLVGQVHQVGYNKRGPVKFRYLDALGPDVRPNQGLELFQEFFSHISSEMTGLTV